MIKMETSDEMKYEINGGTEAGRNPHVCLLPQFRPFLPQLLLHLGDHVLVSPLEPHSYLLLFIGI